MPQNPVSVTLTTQITTFITANVLACASRMTLCQRGVPSRTIEAYHGTRQGNTMHVCPQAQTLQIKALQPSNARVWLGLEQKNGQWMRSGTQYKGWTNWNKNEGNTGEIYAAMVFDSSGWNGMWYDHNTRSRKHWCVCQKGMPCYTPRTQDCNLVLMRQ